MGKHSRNALSQAQKEQIKQAAEAEIAKLGYRLQSQIDNYERMEAEQRSLIPELQDLDLDVLDGDSAALDQIMAKIRLFKEKAHQLKVLQQTPYFLRLELYWKDTKKSEIIYISKYARTSEKIYSWFSPIATLRYAGVGNASYEKPDGRSRTAHIDKKDDYIIQNADIVFMTRETTKMPRQVVFQKHMAQRREFLLPEIVSELDKLQDQIIRTSPEGPFLISGPAGSGKTTLALHRVAYLVLTPEFKDYFTPERIMVFVADHGAVNYFSQLLPELGIHGVKITTFNDWATMIVNSRFRTSLKYRFRFMPESAAIEQIEEFNPYPTLHPSLVLAQYRKFKQEILQPLNIPNKSAKPVYPALLALYKNATLAMDSKIQKGFNQYLKFQQRNHYLDEIDLIILLNSLTEPIQPFTHIVVDEVQNWLPEQLEFVFKIVSHKYDAITFIGDIRQKTKAFSISNWEQISHSFVNNKNRKVELLKVYRNTKPILQHLQNKGYSIEVSEYVREGAPIQQIESIASDQLSNVVSNIIMEHNTNHPNTQLGILAKYSDTLAPIGHLAYEKDNIHALTIQAAQGLEFHSVILLDAKKLNTTTKTYQEEVGYTSADEFCAQDKHLYYVAATRAREKLILIN